MRYDNNGFARYREGDYAIVVRPETDYHSSYWDDKLEAIAGRTVKIIEEESDSDGYYYSVEEHDFVIDIAFLRPAGKFELSEDEEDIAAANMSTLISAFRVVS